MEILRIPCWTNDSIFRYKDGLRAQRAGETKENDCFQGLTEGDWNHPETNRIAAKVRRKLLNQYAWYPRLTIFQLLIDEPENQISLTAFRLLTLDLLTLYSVMNEGTINVLGLSTTFVLSFPFLLFFLSHMLTVFRRTLLWDVQAG